jgi:hypothetical protein
MMLYVRHRWIDRLKYFAGPIKYGGGEPAVVYFITFLLRVVGIWENEFIGPSVEDKEERNGGNYGKDAGMCRNIHSWEIAFN